jgi:hypothetical protein
MASFVHKFQLSRAMLPAIRCNIAGRPNTQRSRCAARFIEAETTTWRDLVKRNIKLAGN